MRKVYVIGSSSVLAPSIAKLVVGDSLTAFIGRSNPYGLENFIKSQGVTDEASVAAISELLLNDLKNTSGITSASLIVLSGVSSNDWKSSFLINEYMPAKLSEDFSKYVSLQKLHDNSVTLIGSSAAYHGAKLPYAATKASLNGIVHSIARGFKNNVRINLVVPSAFESNMIADWDNEKRAAVASSNYIGRLGTPDDMAAAILFTVNNPFITNSTLNMTGGTVHI
ncbi:hypothetical protein CMN24_04325 [Candidatus Saccharibacteria bacterium]|nr:hypothetical protein [Candidatus Saccharibacteria bacterium]